MSTTTNPALWRSIARETTNDGTLPGLNGGEKGIDGRHQKSRRSTHHVTQRGNYRQAVFESDNDRRQYLEWVLLYAQRYGTEVWAYCLMSNHVHFIAL